MASIATLPADVLVDILLQLDHSQQLFNAILATKSIYQAFEDRHTLILQHVWTKQVESDATHILLRLEHAKLRQMLSSSGEYVKKIERISDRCKARPLDGLIIQMSAWKMLIRSGSMFLVRSSFAQSLIARCKALGRTDDALCVGETLLHKLLAYDVYEAMDYLSNHYEPKVAEFAQKLAGMYVAAGRTVDAYAVFRQCCESKIGLRSNSLLVSVLKLHRQDPSSYSLEEFIACFHSKIREERRCYLNRGLQRLKGPQYNTVCLITLYLELGRPQEVHDTFTEALKWTQQNNLDMMPFVGIAQRIIKKFKTQGLTDEALTTRRFFVDKLSTDLMIWVSPSLYLAWSKDYAFELRMCHQEKEALSVEEQALARFNDLVTLNQNNRELRFHYRNAVWAVRKAYRAAGLLTKAAEVESALQSLDIRENQQDDGAGPTEFAADRERSTTLKANVNIPIMA